MALLYLRCGLLLALALSVAAFQLQLLGHRGLTREAFVAHFASHQVPSGLSGKTYAHCKSDSWWKPFGVAPEDSLGKLFHREDQEFNVDAEELMEQLGLYHPPANAPEWDQPLETVADMVLWLAWLRRVREKPGETGFSGHSANSG